MSDLQGKRIALLEGRMHGELAALVRRHGGEPYSVAAMREVPQECGAEVDAFLTRLGQGAIDMVIFLTGVGVNTLVREAEQLGRLPDLLTGLAGVTTVCRGPKPLAALKRQDVAVHLQVPEPHTTAELLTALADVDLAGRRVTVVHYGERNTPLADALMARGAQLEELCLYAWLLPDDLGPLRQLVRDLVARHLDAVAFTSQVQIRHLWHVASQLGLVDSLTEVLATQCAVAAVGPTCAAALEAVGVTPHVVPMHPKMGPMIMALAAYFSDSDIHPRSRAV